MTSGSGKCDRSGDVLLLAVHGLPPSEAASVEAHLTDCSECREQLAGLRPLMESFASWPMDGVRPAASLWGRLAQRIAKETSAEPFVPVAPQWSEPEWEQVAPGISCKILASNAQRNRVSMLVRLAPGVDYPPHTHAGVEELHLLDGELWINERKLSPGDYSRAEPGTGDARVWSETGCTCVLITSPKDRLL